MFGLDTESRTVSGNRIVLRMTGSSGYHLQMIFGGKNKRVHAEDDSHFLAVEDPNILYRYQQ